MIPRITKISEIYVHQYLYNYPGYLMVADGGCLLHEVMRDDNTESHTVDYTRCRVLQMAHSLHGKNTLADFERKNLEHYSLSSLCIHLIYCWTCSYSTSSIRRRTINKFSKNYCTLLQARHVTFSTQDTINLHFLTCAFDSSRQTIG